MERLRIAMLDDEKGALKNLTNILEQFIENVEIVASFNDPEVALEKIKQLNIDVLFLDINMPKLNGFDFLQKLDLIDFQIVFITAFEKYAIRAFKSNAVDYLLKPINVNTLRETIENVRKLKTAQNVNVNLESKSIYHRSLLNLFNPSVENKYQDKISVKTTEGTYEIISVHEVIRVTSASSGIVYYLNNGSQFFSNISVKECLTILNPELFIRCHLSHIVNKEFIARVSMQRNGRLYLTNGDEIPVSARRKNEVLKHF